MKPKEESGYINISSECWSCNIVYHKVLDKQFTQTQWHCNKCDVKWVVKKNSAVIEDHD